MWKVDMLLRISTILLFHHASAFQNDKENFSFHDPSEMGINMTDISLTTFFTLTNESRKGSVSKDFIAEAERASRRYFFDWFPLRHYGDYTDVILACYYIQTTYRNAMTDMRRYYYRRSLYRATLEYEVGFLTHEIVWRYRAMLELYHYLVRWYEGYWWRNFAPTQLVFYIYTNVVQHSIAIIHLCNMMHELERRYRVKPRMYGVFDDYDFKRGGDSSKDGKDQKAKFNKSEVDENLAAYEAYLMQLRKDAKRKKKEARERRKNVLKLGVTTTRGRATAKSYWPIHYGWSIEFW